MKKKFIGKVLLVAAVGVWSSLFLVFQLLPGKPDPIVLSLPETEGRVYGPGDVRPGTFFTINRSFEEVSSWGSNAIIRWRIVNGGLGRSPAIVWEAWRPDSETIGVFEYAVRYDETGWSSVFEATARVNGSQIKLVPERTGESALLGLGTIVVSLIVSLFLFSLGVGIIKNS